MKKLMTICFLTREVNGKTLVCLAEKKRGFREGKINGYGGKLKKGESPQECIIRETKEEAGVLLTSPTSRGKIVFNDPGIAHECHIYIAQKWRGSIKETEEMKPDWYPINKIPFKKMGEADSIWIPPVLKGKKVKAAFYYDQNNFMYKIDLKFLGE